VAADARRARPGRQQEGRVAQAPRAQDRMGRMHAPTHMLVTTRARTEKGMENEALSDALPPLRSHFLLLAASPRPG